MKSTSATPEPFQPRLACAAAALSLFVLVACDKKADGATTADTNAPGAAPVAAGAAKAKTTLQAASMRSAYASEFNDNSKMTNPMEAKVSAFVAKVGKPETDTGRKKTWFALDGDKCAKVELDTSDGSLTDSTTSNADCGL